MTRIVRTLVVTSSPLTPLPRVAPRANLTVDVRQGDADAIDLQLGDVIDSARWDARLGQAAAHAIVERAQLAFVVRIVETQHRFGVRDFLKPLRHRPLTRCVGESTLTRSG